MRVVENRIRTGDRRTEEKERRTTYAGPRRSKSLSHHATSALWKKKRGGGGERRRVYHLTWIPSTSLSTAWYSVRKKRRRRASARASRGASHVFSVCLASESESGRGSE